MDPADASFTPTYLAYAGEIIALFSSQIAAAYATFMAIENAVYFLYAGYSPTFDLWGLWELIIVFMYIAWALGISITGYVEAAFLWEKYEAMELADETMTWSDGCKFLALGFLIGGGASISGSSLATSSDAMLKWFDAKTD